MWWILGFYDIVWPLLALKELASTARLEVIASRFFMLGLIPGTSYQIGFSDIVIAVWVIIFLYATYRLYLKAQDILNKLNPYRRLPSGLVYLNLIAL